MRDLLINAFALLLATIDPIGTLALFAGVTSHLSPAERRSTAILATLYSGAILVGSIAVGQFVLDFMGVHLASMQLAGGIILFLFGLQMLFGSPGSKSATPESGRELAVFPLAVPSIASPGAILAAIMLTDNDTRTVTEQVAVSAVLVLVLALTLVAMLLATPILRIIGRGGAALLVRIMGMLLAALAVELVMTALGAKGWVDAG